MRTTTAPTALRSTSPTAWSPLPPRRGTGAWRFDRSSHRRCSRTEGRRHGGPSAEAPRRVAPPGRLDPEHPHLEGEGGGLGYCLHEASIAPHEPRCPSAGRLRDGPQQKNDQEPQPHHREGRREADQRRRAEDRDQGDERTQSSGQEDRDVRGLHGVVRDRFLHGPFPARGLVVPQRAENARSVAARVPASTSADVRAAMAATARPAAPASTPAPTAHHRSTATSTEDRPTRGTSTWSAPSADRHHVIAP